MATVVIGCDYVMYLSCVKYMWSVFLILMTYHFLTDNSLQSAYKDQQKSRPAAEKPHDAVDSTFYFNL